MKIFRKSLWRNIATNRRNRVSEGVGEMIKEERLKELIEKEATVYYVDYDKVRCFKLDKTQSGHNLDILYETKSEAEFEFEFGNVEKTIKMPKPPTWKEFCNTSEIRLFIITIKKYNFAITVINCKIELIYRYGMSNYEFIGTYDFTEENYIKALRKMKELWLEEVC